MDLWGIGKEGVGRKKGDTQMGGLEEGSLQSRGSRIRRGTEQREWKQNGRGPLLGDRGGGASTGEVRDGRNEEKGRAEEDPG